MQIVYIDPEGDGDVRIEDSGSGEASVYALEDIIHAAECKTVKIGIINGYAKNEKLYKVNNRIKTPAINGKAFELADTFSREFRFFDVPEENDLSISSATLYNGTGYTDTCIAEITVE